MARLGLMCLLVIALTLPLTFYVLAQNPTNTTVYVYDELGRLAAVIDPSGETAVYNYDAAGNVVSITRRSSNVVSIIEFTPQSGAAGHLVTVYGTGFSAVPAENTVHFNGAPAEVASATATQLTARVPAAATTGPITVTTPAGTAASSKPFKVNHPVITGFTPSVGTPGAIGGGPGTEVTITGTNFAADPPDNLTAFNGYHSQVGAASATSVTTSVPYRATSGRISLTTAAGTATSGGDFFVAPPPFTAADVELTARMALGESRTLTIGAPNKIGLVVFDAAAGQRLSLHVTGVTIASTTLTVYRPSGTTLISPTTFNTGGRFFDSQTVPATGTYTILIDPNSTNTGNLTLSLYSPADITGTITPGGPPVTVTTITPGQNARLTFDGAQGQRVSLRLSGVTIPSSVITLLKPDGTNLTSPLSMGTSNGFIDTQTLPAAGTYAIQIDPQGSATGNMTLTLYDVADLTASIAIDGPPLTLSINIPGQSARVTFDGAQGQRVSLKMDNVTTGSATVAILKPDGTNLASPTFVGNSGGFFDAQTLPAAGAYTILVDPQSSNTGGMRLTLYGVTDVTGTIAIGGPTVSVNTTTPGQNARLTFDGAQGQRVSLKVTGVTFQNSVSVTIQKPDGTTLGQTLSVGTSGGFLEFPPLPVAGSYTIFINPNSSATGGITLQLHEVPPDVTGALEIGGPPVAVTITTPGQNAQLTFSGTAGQRIIVEAYDADVYDDLKLSAPGGAEVYEDDGYTFARTLPATGTYTLVVDPYEETYTTHVVVYAVPPDPTAGTITPGGPPVVVSVPAYGQNAKLTFTGTAGQRVSLRIQETTIGPIYSNIDIYRPNGSYLTGDYAYPDHWVASGWLDVSDRLVDTVTLPDTGTYTIAVDPSDDSSGRVKLTLYNVPPDITGTITAGGPPVTVTTTVPGQDIRLTFSGTAGQRVSLKVSNPAYLYSHVNLQGPGVASVSGSSFFTYPEGSFADVFTLPATGTYTIINEIYLGATASPTYTLYDVPPDPTGTITIGGPPVTLTATAAGQDAQVTFQGTTGQRIGIKVTGSLPVDTYVRLYSPSNFRFDYAPVRSYGAVNGVYLSTDILFETGTHRIEVDTWDAPGDMTLTLYEVPPDVEAGTLTVGGPPVTVTATVPRQNLRLTFDANAGQYVTLKTSNVPSSYRITVLRPDGTVRDYTETGIAEERWLEEFCSVAGTYTVVVDMWGEGESITLALSDGRASVNQTITPGGPPVTVNIPTVGRYGEVTFSGTAGQRVSLRMNDVTIPFAYLDLYGPDGQRIPFSNEVGYNVGYLGTTGVYQYQFSEVLTLPLTGTYRMEVWPDNFGKWYWLYTGSVKLTLWDVPPDPAYSITPNGPPVEVTAGVPGQNPELEFDGTSGQQVTVQLSNNTIGKVSIEVLKPWGTWLAYDTTSDGSFSTPTLTLPSPGRYKIRINPWQAGSGTVSVGLTSP